jgi:hypothetical protein
MTVNEFSERYKDYSTLKLLEIIEKQSEYKPEAFEAAKAELESRNLNEREIDKLRLEHEMKEDHLKRRKLNSIDIDGFFNRIFKAIVDLFNPKINKSPDVIVPIIGTLFLIYIIYTIITDIYTFRFLLTYSILGWDSYTLIYVLTFIAIPVGAVYLILKKKTGWIILNLVCTRLFLIELFSIISVYRFRIEYEGYDESFLPGYDLHFIFLIIFFLPLYYFNKKSIREYFAGSKTEQWLSILPIALITYLLWFRYY